MLSWTSISAIGKQLKVGSSYTTSYIYTYICMDPWWESIFFIFAVLPCPIPNSWRSCGDDICVRMLHVVHGLIWCWFGSSLKMENILLSSRNARFYIAIVGQ